MDMLEEAWERGTVLYEEAMEEEGISSSNSSETH